MWWFLSILLVSLIRPLAVFGDETRSFTASVRVGLANITLNGTSCASCTIYFKENGSVTGTATSDSSGLWTKTFTGLEDGVHDISIYSTYSNSHTSGSVVQSVALSGTDVTVNDIVLLPTLVISNTSVGQGNNWELSGYVAPNASVFVSVVDTALSTTVVSDSLGYWYARISTSSLSVGSYSIKLKTILSGGSQSILSTGYGVEVTTATSSSTSSSTSPTSTPAILINVGPIIIYVPKIILPELIGDYLGFRVINEDEYGKVKIDKGKLFELVRTWVDTWREKSPTIAIINKCDLNGDKDCDIYDFSILMFFVQK